MKVTFSDRFTRSFVEAPERVQREFGKQLGHLFGNIRHPSLQAKKYHRQPDLWQARVDLNWRFYFTVEEDGYHIHDIIPHP